MRPSTMRLSRCMSFSIFSQKAWLIEAGRDVRAHEQDQQVGDLLGERPAALALGHARRDLAELLGHQRHAVVELLAAAVPEVVLVVEGLHGRHHGLPGVAVLLAHDCNCEMSATSRNSAPSCCRMASRLARTSAFSSMTMTLSKKASTRSRRPARVLSASL